ncbi:hypothetical protein BDW22DRAFT_159012 [Trametopsis cervina]|nr:hypothetical protein BDW22DRAFT_159012 [Trametopsis cervina]
MINFPSPILSVSPEVVRDLEGEDALYGMWTVFTKCKQSLKDGRRLENMSWRLWYREMSLAHPSSESLSPLSSGSSSPSLSDADSLPPTTPVSETGSQNRQNDNSNDSLLSVPSPHVGPERHSWHGEGVPPPVANIRRLSTASMPVRPMHPQRAGSIIADILPAKLDVPAPRQSSPGTTIPTSSRVSLARASGPNSNPSTPKPSPAGSTFMQSAMLRPALGMSPAGVPLLSAPQVVVVNPTPHPTPPATPHSNSHMPSNAGKSSLEALKSLSQSEVVPGSGNPPPSPLSSTSAASSSTSPSSSSASSKYVVQIWDQAKEAQRQWSAKDDTLKQIDRRFFLQTSQSPDGESPERSQQLDIRAASTDLPEPHSSTKSVGPLMEETLTPSIMTKSASTADIVETAHTTVVPPPRRTTSKTMIGRRGREVPRFTTAAKAGGKGPQRPHLNRKVTESKEKKPTFNVGSASSNGTRASGPGRDVQPRTQAQKPKPPAVQPEQIVVTPPVAPATRAAPPALSGLSASLNAGAGPAKGKGPMMSTSSEYTTDSDDDDDDSGWASEDGNTNDDKDKNREKDKDKERKQRDAKLREAAEEAQRQRDMFAKMPRRSYTDLSRTQSGLLTQLLNPDPSLFPPEHPYRSSHGALQFGKQGGRLPPSRSAAALPLTAMMTPMTVHAPLTNGADSGNAGPSGYRPKGRPQDEELETDTEEEGGENGLELSRSLAQQKLAQLAGPSRRRVSDQQANAPSGLTQSKLQHQGQRHPQRSAMTSVATAPLPLNHPYNLPAPAPPMTAHTTRRTMLSRELSESLRRNLLWERQITKANQLAVARRQRLQPLTTVNPPQPVDEREERRMARNRSWADDYHQVGW